MNQTPHSQEKIYIYMGPGVSKVALQHTNITLHELIAPHFQIQTISPKEVKEGLWKLNAALFIMPGGADILYARSLKDKGNQQIRDYVHQGGRYLGICAGAYYGGQCLRFATGTPQEIITKRELAFFPDVIEGPTLKPWDHKTNSGADVALLHWKDSNNIFPDNHLLYVYYNGGGHYVNARTHKNVKILADYATTSPSKHAIVEVQASKGIAILSSVHCEFAPEAMDQSDPYLKPLIQKLTSTDHDRKLLMCHLLNRLNIETNNSKLATIRKG